MRLLSRLFVPTCFLLLPYLALANTQVTSMETAPTGSAGGRVLFNGFMLTMYAFGLLGLAWPLWGVWRWRGCWRLAAALPCAGGAFVVLRIIIDTVRDPTSHNLWPFEIVMWCGLSVLWIFALNLIKRLLQRKQ